MGGTIRSEAILSLSVSGVETVEIDDVSAYAVTIEYLQMQAMSETFKEGLCAASVALGDASGTTAKIAVVTQVFYARGIKYVYGSTLESAFRAIAGEGAYPDLPNKTVAEGRPATNPDEVGAKMPNPPAVDLSELATQTTPGLVGRFATARGDNLMLEEVFERPLAFGVDVLVIPISNLNINCSKIKVNNVEPSKGTALTAPPEKE